ncbi:hydroxyethylthiazole kinase [Clostridium paraputrificum]|uniref:hydroxyethylthiazole kinase n=1 Tax=Clostridium paraputrificum TaxID=29363 RepID=UPI0006C2BAFB|nr:hydroxyethylthiazole kinase [Clostridium paraputrificum]CUQ27858.1 hydroxyethylthiazole kinase [Clostridium paraputrificum]
MDIKTYIGNLLENVRERAPLVHHITNYVTVNDCANITLSIGASPVMADDINEVEAMTSIASSLVINIGTLNSRTVECMIKAGKKANEVGIPVILDPVGAGATPYRTKVAKTIMDNIELAVIRGNLSEIKTLYGINTKTKGVDSLYDTFIKDELEKGKLLAKDFSKRVGSIIAITGAVDIVTDGKMIYTVENGHKIMSKITGTGCMCSSLIGSYLGTNEDNLLAALSGVVSMGISGELAYESLKEGEGTGTFKVKLMDNIYNLSKEVIEKRGKINEEC